MRNLPDHALVSVVEAPWVGAAVALAAAALGGVIAATAGWFQARLQRRWQIEDFQRMQAAARDQEVRARADQRAEQILSDLDELEGILLRDVRRYLWPADRTQLRQARKALTRISKSALYLQQPLRRHVLLATRTLAEADQLVEGRWVSDSPRMIGVVVIRRVRELVARYLRNERVPPELSDRFEQYQIGLNNLDEYIEHQLESQIESGQDSDRV